MDINLLSLQKFYFGSQHTLQNTSIQAANSMQQNSPFTYLAGTK